MADFSLNVKINGVDQAVNTVSQIEQALIATREELKNVAIGSDAFQKLSTQAQTLQREFVNSYKETTNFNKGIAELGQSVGSLASTVTAGFSIATSAFALFGAESEDISEAQVKAQQALALALGATTIATNAKTLAEDLGNVAAALGLNISRASTSATIVDTEATVVNTSATIANTAASGADAVAKQAEAVATTEAAVAQEGLNVAMAANPIGLVLAGLTALIGALVLFADSEETAKSNTKEANTALLEQSDLLKKQSDDFIAVYKLRKEVDILSIKDATERAKKTKELEEEIAGLQGKAAEEQISRVKNANEVNIKDFENYKEAYTGIKREIVSVTTEFDEFGVAIGQQENYRDVEYKVGQDVLNNLKTNLEERKKEIDKSVKDGTYTQEEGNILTQQAQTKFYIEYLVKQKSFLAQSTQADDKQRAENLTNLIESFKQVRGQLEKAYAEQQKIAEEAEKKKLEAERKAEEEAAKKAADALKERQRKYKEAYNEIVKTVKDATKQLAEAETSYLQDLEKARLDKTKTAVDNLKYEQQLEKEKVDKVKQLALDELNSSVLFNKKKGTLTEEGKKKQLEIEKQYSETIIALNDVYLDKVKTTTEEELKLEQEKADKLKLINDVLNSEIAFGDQNLLDSKASLKQRERQLEIDSLDFTKQIEMAKGELSIEEYIKYQDDRLKLLKKYNEEQKKIDDARIIAERNQSIGNFTENLKKEFGIEFVATKEGKDLIEKFTLNADEELKVKQAELNQKYRQAEIDADKAAEDAKLQYKLDKASQFVQLAQQFSQGLAEINNLIDQNQNQRQQANIESFVAGEQAKADAVEAAYQADIANNNYTEEEKKAKREAANKQIVAIQDASNKAIDKSNRELAEKQFKRQKALNIVNAVINGAQAVLQAIANFGPPPSPLGIAGIAAAGIITAAQIAAIASQKFDGGATGAATSVSTPSIPDTSPNTGAANVASAASSGGFTGFNQNLLGTPGGAGATGTVLNPQGPQRVYVLESDITNSQRRVETLESNATFG